MNILPKSPRKGVLPPSISYRFRSGNFLHTGGVACSIHAAPTTPILAFSSLERSSQRFTRTREELLARHVELPELTQSDWNRFWSKVDRSAGLFGCWPWKAAKSGDGYGRFKLDGKLWSPHRIAAASKDGGIPRSSSYHGFLVMHSCDNPACCNPAHLTIGTQSENVRDMDRKGRRNVVPSSKHPAELIALIQASAESSRKLGAKLGLNHGFIREVRRRKARAAGDSNG